MRVAPRQDQRLILQFGNADGVATGESVTFGHHHVDVVDEQAAPLQAGGLGHRNAGQVVHHRDIDVAAA